METLLTQGIGWAAFVLGTLAAGMRLRARPVQANANRLTRVEQALFALGLLGPQIAGIFSIGLGNYDGFLSSRRGLGYNPYMQMLGAPVLALGVALLILAAREQARAGRGWLGLKFGGAPVLAGVYSRMRHPMALGYCLALVGLSIVAGSRVLLGAAAVLYVPATVLYLRFFKERALQIQYGEAYQAYQRRTPFMLPDEDLPVDRGEN